MRAVLTAIIHDSGLTDAAVGDGVGVSKQAVGKWKRTGAISKETVAALERLFALEHGEIARRVSQYEKPRPGAPRVAVLARPKVPACRKDQHLIAVVDSEEYIVKLWRALSETERIRWARKYPREIDAKKLGMGGGQARA